MRGEGCRGGDRGRAARRRQPVAYRVLHAGGGEMEADNQSPYSTRPGALPACSRAMARQPSGPDPFPWVGVLRQGGSGRSEARGFLGRSEGSDSAGRGGGAQESPGRTAGTSHIRASVGGATADWCPCSSVHICSCTRAALHRSSLASIHIECIPYSMQYLSCGLWRLSGNGIVRFVAVYRFWCTRTAYRIYTILTN